MVGMDDKPKRNPKGNTVKARKATTGRARKQSAVLKSYGLRYKH